MCYTSAPSLSFHDECNAGLFGHTYCKLLYVESFQLELISSTAGERRGQKWRGRRSVVFTGYWGMSALICSIGINRECRRWYLTQRSQSKRVKVVEKWISASRVGSLTRHHSVSESWYDPRRNSPIIHDAFVLPCSRSVKWKQPPQSLSHANYPVFNSCGMRRVWWSVPQTLCLRRFTIYFFEAAPPASHLAVIGSKAAATATWHEVLPYWRLHVMPCQANDLFRQKVLLIQ